MLHKYVLQLKSIFQPHEDNLVVEEHGAKTETATPFSP